MKLFADTSNYNEIKELKELGIISGVTTNPTIAAKCGPNFKNEIKRIAELMGDMPVLAQITERTPDKMIDQAMRISDLAENMVVKVPGSYDGLKVISTLAARGRRTCATAVLTSAQALWTALAGATYVAPYVGECDNMGYNGFDTLKEIVEIFKSSDVKAEVLAAAILRPHDIAQVAVTGAHILTTDYNVIRSVCDFPMPMQEFFVDRFCNDWNNAGCEV